MLTKTKYATCESCGLEMKPGVGCTIKTEQIGETYYRRIPNSFEVNCYDCNAAPGKAHHPNCDWEVCPKCGGQAIGCNCYEFSEEELDA